MLYVHLYLYTIGLVVLCATASLGTNFVYKCSGGTLQSGATIPLATHHY